jgi:hypothetical protein
MKYIDKYKPPDVTYTAHPDIEVSSGLVWTDRKYPCCTCRQPTGFRIDIEAGCPGQPCCSEACRPVEGIEAIQVIKKG